MAGEARARGAELGERAHAALQLGVATDGQHHHLHDRAKELGGAVSEALHKGSAVASRAAAGAVGGAAVDPTIVRRNYLLVAQHGDLEKSLAMVSHRQLLIEVIPNLMMSAVPFAGAAYAMIEPVWAQLRDVCLIAALYGHDLQEEDVQAAVLDCAVGEHSDHVQLQRERHQHADKKWKVASSVDALAKKMATKFASNSATAMAVCSGPIAPVVRHICDMGMSIEVAKTHALAHETFARGSRTIPESEYNPSYPDTPSGSEVKSWIERVASFNQKEAEVQQRAMQAGRALDTKLHLSEAGAAARRAAAHAARSADGRLHATERVASARQAVSEATRRTGRRAKDKAMNAAQSHIEQNLDSANKLLVERITNQLDMPRFLRKVVKQVIEDVVHGIKMEAEYGLESALHLIPGAIDDGPEDPSVRQSLGCLGKLRGWCLYQWMPYNHGPGWLWVNPVWIGYKLLAAIPATSCVFYGIVWLLIERSDDFQLTKFILDFKGLQSVSLGIGSLFVGGTRYVICANTSPEPSCDTRGPGASQQLAMAGWLACVALVWLAFLQMQCRQRRQSARNERRESGGALTHAFRYEVCSFLGCAALIVANATNVEPLLSDAWWRDNAQLVFWSRALYGVLSLPFLVCPSFFSLRHSEVDLCLSCCGQTRQVFMLPLVDVLFTHAHATGYTPSGQLRTKITPHPADDLQRRAVAVEAMHNSNLAVILEEMLYVAIDGGPLPVERWSQMLAPALDHYVDIWHSAKDRVRTIAEVKAGGSLSEVGSLAQVKAVAGGAVTVAAMESVEHGRAAGVAAVHKAAAQIVRGFAASLELPRVLAREVEELAMSVVPDLAGQAFDNVSEAVDKMTDHAGIDLGVDLAAKDRTEATEASALRKCLRCEFLCFKWLRAYILYSWAPYDRHSGGLLGRLLRLLTSLPPIFFTSYLVTGMMFVLTDKTDVSEAPPSFLSRMLLCGAIRRLSCV
eukprot:COSAG01_NODE_1149_length_11506_cov_141.610049_6_plen_968_part_00